MGYPRKFIVDPDVPGFFRYSNNKSGMRMDQGKPNSSATSSASSTARLTRHVAQGQTRGLTRAASAHRTNAPVET